MAYQSGLATDRFDLINKLRIFAESIGWVTDDLRTAAEGVTGYWFCHNAAATGYWAFSMYSGGSSLGPILEITSNSGYTAGLDAHSQPGGGDFGARINLWQEPYLGYDFFGSEDYLHVAVQMSAGRFRHFGIGEIDNKTAYSGGQYAFGNWKSGSTSGGTLPTGAIAGSGTAHVYSNVFGSKGQNTSIPSGGPVLYNRRSHIRMDSRVHFFSWSTVATQTPNPPTGQIASGPGGGHIDLNETNPDAGLVSCGRSQFGQLVNLIPFNMYLQWPDAGWRLVGHAKDMAVCRMTAIGAKDVLNIGGDDWMIIPALQYQPNSGDVSGMETSWDLGYAYKMVV